MNGLRCLGVAALTVACSSPAPKQGTAAVSSPQGQVAAPAFRLPGDVQPTAYELDLTIDPTAQTSSGRIAIRADVVRATKMIWLHAAPAVKIGRARVAGRDAHVTRRGDFVGVAAERAAGPVIFELEFTAPIDHERSRGIYAEKEGSDTYAYTFFEPIDARRAFPCFDEPAYKAPWTLVLHVKPDQVALANAPIARERTDDKGKHVEFVPTKPLPSYLVAFVVGPFEIVDGGTGGRAKTPIRFVIPKGRAPELNWAKQVTPRVVAALEDYFDMPYPFVKLDVAVVPRFWGTMEHPGLVAMGQPLTLIRPAQETRKRKRAYANILAHELAHYWFGDYVTMKWWDDTWLNESLGQWLDMIITDGVEPAWRFRDDRVRLSTSAMESDEALSTQAIRQPVKTNEAIAASFDGEIIYMKGSTVMRMFEAWVGPDKWRDLMRAHVRKHAWGTATANDFFDLVGSQLGEPVEQALRGFVDQPGAPLVTFEPHCETGKLDIRQTRALPAGLTDPAQPLWRVPVCFRYGDVTSKHDSCTLLETRSTTLPLATCPTWFVPNQDARGYYRSSIDAKYVEPLLNARTAGNAKPTAPERMMMVADLRAMVERGELAIDRVLALAPTIVADPDLKVAGWATVAASFRIDALDDQLYQAGRAWFTKAFGPMARRLRWTASTSDSDERQRLRNQLVPMIAYHDPKLGVEAERLADRWLRDGKGIEDDLFDSVLAVAAYRGTAQRFDKYLAAVQTAKDRTEGSRILGALATFKDPALATRALELVLGTAHDLRETRGIVLRMLGVRETRDLALDFLAKHLDTLLPRMRADEASWFLGAIAGSFCDPDRRKRAAELVTARAAKVDGAQAAVARGLDKSAQCIAELARVLPDLKPFLSK